MIGIYYLCSLKEWDFNFVTTQRKSTAACQQVGESWTFGCGARQSSEAASAAPWCPWQDGLSLCLSLSLSGGNEPSFKRCFVYICPSLRTKHNTSPKCLTTGLWNPGQTILISGVVSGTSTISVFISVWFIRQAPAGASLILSRTSPYDLEAISAYPQWPPLLLPPLSSLLSLWIHRTQTCSRLTL